MVKEAQQFLAFLKTPQAHTIFIECGWKGSEYIYGGGTEKRVAFATMGPADTVKRRKNRRGSSTSRSGSETTETRIA